MGFRVLKKFRDKDGTVYEPKSEYPTKGVSKERLKQLSTKANRYKYLFIEEIKATKKVAKNNVSKG